MGHHDLERDQQRARQRGELEHGLLPRHEVRRERAKHHEHLEDDLQRVQVRHPGGVELPPIPQRERRLPAKLEADRPVVEDRRRVQRVAAEQEHPEREHRGGEEPRDEQHFARGLVSPFGYDAHNGTRISGANFPTRPARAPASRRGTATAASPARRNAGGTISFVFEPSAYSVNGYAAQANASVAASLRPARRHPISARRPRQSVSNRTDVSRAAGRSPRLAVPAEEPVAGEIGLVHDRSVRVAERLRHLAAPTVLEAPTRVAVQSAGPHTWLFESGK